MIFMKCVVFEIFSFFDGMDFLFECLNVMICFLSWDIVVEEFIDFF